MTTITCHHCGIVFESQRRTRKFCSRACSNRATWVVTKTRQCRHCGKDFPVSGVGDVNRQHCSSECAKNHAAKTTKGWMAERPEAMKRYNANRVAKDPTVWTRKHGLARLKILELLGSQCVVCGVTNPLWLHVDFIAGSRGLQYRHPRHLAYVRTHQTEFRVLCANHHYELTLSGRIEGTDITQ